MRHKTYLLLHTALFLAMAAPATSHAEAEADVDLDYLISLDLESLMDITVYSSSKNNEKIHESSSTITKFTRKDMDNLGYHNIGDLADITPGYGTHIRFGERVLETRGQRAASFNNDKHLLLIDGVPIHHARNYKVPTEDELPLFFADSIEFIRGPASALYGTSAFFGAISIQTSSPKDDMGKTHGNTRATVSTLDAYRQSSTNIYKSSSWGKTTANFTYTDKNASKDAIRQESSTDWKNHDDKQSTFFFGKHEFDQGSLKGLSVNLLYSNKDGSLGEFWNNGGSSSYNDLRWETIAPFIKYETQLNDQMKSHSFIKYNRSREIGDYIASPNGQYESFVENVEANTELNFDVTQTTNWVTGLNLDKRRERGYPDSKSQTLGANGWTVSSTEFVDTTKWFQTFSAYTQIKQKFDILEGFIATVGTRFDGGKAENQSYSQTSPRLAFVQNITPKHSIRINYATALRAPGIKEIGLNNEGNERVGAVSPEKFKVKEIGASYHTDDFTSNLTIFESRTSNAITATQVNGENKLINQAGTTKSTGIEGEIKYRLTPKLMLNVNASTASSESPDGQDLASIPKHKANLILQYEDSYKNLPYSLAVVNKWVSDYTTSDSSEENGRHLTTDINARLHIGDASTVELKVINLFNDVYYQPNSNQEQIRMPGTAAFLTLSHKF